MKTESKDTCNDIWNDPQYQKWVERLAGECKCSGERPCAGLLAGGLCDELNDDEEYWDTAP